MLLNQNTKLLHHHVYDDFDMDTVVGSVVQNQRTQHSGESGNEDKVNWTYQTSILWYIYTSCSRKDSRNRKGVKILFPESTGEFK